MKKYLLPILIALSALSISAAAAFYSVTGLAKLFAGVEIAVIWMATSLEVAKLVVASLLYQYWKDLSWGLKTYFTVALVTLMLITSAGIYGYLSSGYQDTANKTGVVDKEITLIENKIKTQESNKNFTLQQLTQTQQSISQLRLALGNNIQTSKDRQGNLITTTSSANRKSYEKQLEFALNEEKTINAKLNNLDSVLLKLSEQKLEKESNVELAGELGPLKYISGLTGVSMDRIINWFLLVIIFVFDPLAISLVIAANFAFKNANKHLYTIYNEQPEKPVSKLPKEPQVAPDIQKEIENIKAQSLSAWKRKKLIKDLLGKTNNDQINYM
jgi:hypothetical protein